MANSAWSWPSAMSRSWTSRATSASVRPTSRPAAIWATTRSAAWAASVSRAISSSSLTMRSWPRIGDASAKVAPSSRSWSRSRCRAGRSSETAIRRSVAPGRRVADHPGDERVRVAPLVPGHDRQEPAGSRRARAGGRRLQARCDERPVPARRDDEHGQALERRRRVAREIVHVGADPDQDGSEACLTGEVPGGGEPVSVAFGRDGRTGHGRHARLSTAGAVASHAAIWRGPSSNRRR